MNNIDKKKEILDKLVSFLNERYDDAKCTLNYTTPFQLLVATILSAQCTDERVNKVTKKLFSRVETPEQFVDLPLEELIEIIRPAGFYNNKSRNIKKLSSLLVEKYKGEVPKSIDELVKLPGVGRKTANVVLGNCFGIKGVVVDTHVQRIVKRLGIVNCDDPVKIEHAIMELLPQIDWTKWSHQMIAFGRDICKAKTPECAICNLRNGCNYFKKLAK